MKVEGEQPWGNSLGAMSQTILAGQRSCLKKGSQSSCLTPCSRQFLPSCCNLGFILLSHASALKFAARLFSLKCFRRVLDVPWQSKGILSADMPPENTYQSLPGKPLKVVEVWWLFHLNFRILYPYMRKLMTEPYLARTVLATSEIDSENLAVTKRGR